MAVAARDLSRAKEFAKKHDIPKAYGSYEELAKDPDVGEWHVRRRGRGGVTGDAAFRVLRRSEALRDEPIPLGCRKDSGLPKGLWAGRRDDRNRFRLKLSVQQEIASRGHTSAVKAGLEFLSEAFQVLNTTRVSRASAFQRSLDGEAGQRGWTTAWLWSQIG